MQFYVIDKSGRGFAATLNADDLIRNWSACIDTDDATLAEWLTYCDVGDEFHDEDNQVKIIRTK